MNKNLKFSQILSIGFLLFAILFGAGNVIFPPILGQLAGKNMLLSISGFIFADVGLSLLAIIAVVLAGGSFYKLANRVHPKFSKFFTGIIYFVIGPLCVIPRTGVVSYETSMASIITPGSTAEFIARIIFTAIFFGITYFLALNPSKLVDRIGKIITPILLILIALITIKSCISPIGVPSQPIGDYATIPFFKGFSSGYLTLDGLGALILSIIVIDAIKGFGVTNSKTIAKNTIIGGVIASIALMFVYFSLGYIGASSISLGVIDNGAILLGTIMNILFGKLGIILLGLVVTLACLTTSIGITSSFGNYFSKRAKKSSYKKIIGLVCIVSFVISNLGLTLLLKVTEPVLTLLYPIAIVLILVSFIDKFINSNSYVYIYGMIGASIVSVLNILDNFNLLNTSLSTLVNNIPLYNLGIGWVIPAIIGCILGYCIHFDKKVAIKSSSI